MQSIRKTLLWWLSGGLLAGIVAATFLIYAQARQEANALFDYQMQQVAAALPSQWIDPPPPALAGIAHDDDVVIRIWDDTGRSLYLSHARPDLPTQAELGFSDVVTPEGTWRVYSVAFGPAVVQIAQPYSARHEVAARMALRTVVPLLILLPLLAWLVWLAVGRGLSPLGTVARQVQTRDAAALSPLPTHGLPAEIRPLTTALNDLLARLGGALAHQRAFVADAAHALRTPLAALKLQLQVADRAQSEDERRAAHADLHRGVERMIRLVGQLLTLARQGPAPPTRSVARSRSTSSPPRWSPSCRRPRCRSGSIWASQWSRSRHRSAAMPMRCACCWSTWSTTPSATALRAPASMCRPGMRRMAARS